MIAGVRDAFLDDGVDEQVLQEMKQVWTNKLMSSKAVEITIDPLEPQPPPMLANNKVSFFVLCCWPGDRVHVETN